MDNRPTGVATEMAAQLLQGKEKTLLAELSSLVREVRANLCGLVQEWGAFQSEVLHTGLGAPVEEATGKTLQVSRSDMERLVTEAMMLKEFLPRVLSPEYLAAPSRLTHVEQELQAAQRDKQVLSSEHEHLKRRSEALLVNFEQEKQEKFSVKCEVTELSQQLTQQAEFCSSMGAACCTLLWRVSRHEDCIHSILGGSKVSEFLTLTGSTLQSFLATYGQGEMPGETSEEAQFVLALCGIITNIAASAYGRDFLASSGDGQALVDVLCGVLAEAPPGAECTKLKSLLLMSLYNISINQKGLGYLSSKPELMPVLVWHLQEETSVTNRLHIIRLLQSLILEPESPEVTARALEAIPLPVLQHLASDTNPEVRELALELMADLQALQREP